AYRPSARFPRAAETSPCCQASKGIPMRPNCCETEGQAVETIPSGRTRCRATSESLGLDHLEPELTVAGGAFSTSTHLRVKRSGLPLQLLNLARNIPRLTN